MEIPSEISAGDFPTGFCTTPQACKATIYTFIGYFMGVFLVYLLAMHFTSLAPFSNGLIIMTKYIFLYGIIITTIVLFISLIGAMNWWVSLFLWYVERFIFPLRDHKTSSWYYYFTDYVNWIIYGGAMIYFLCCVIFLVGLLCLLLLPGIAVVGFFIGYLFSLLGEAPCAAKIVETATKSVMDSKLGEVINPIIATTSAVSNTVTQVASNPAPAQEASTKQAVTGLFNPFTKPTVPANPVK
jgi:hypothetical protein